ncbi:hypothetical protein [Haliovirga abyssi]|uniref:Lipoprotein n=1 Tax=Haliovirga abyssi TaxID=2996794 RepID=A0AAU9DI32_9FUSO|nr:hypothetical protein [Haliovirga abyssi]BDU50414.1 hypothetical protein HLVA_09830 [Haliovirga abyssi]
MKKRILIVCILTIVILFLTSCSNNTEKNNILVLKVKSTGQIYLYGERHGIKKILDKEIELWDKYYNNQGMRHLFIEVPYYTAKLLNIWMKSDSDDIFNSIYHDWEGTDGHNPDFKEFFKKIKRNYPKTIFHGTDVGHQYETTGKRFLKYLKDNKLNDSKQYFLTKKAIAQGKYYYSHSDEVYRENMMVKNFIYEFENLNGKNIMGIYGASHTGIDMLDVTRAVPCMANQLKKYYSNNIHSKDLSKEPEPERVDKIKVGGKIYKASYFGKWDLPEFKEFKYREFWRLEDAYNDFIDNPKTQSVLPYNDYPMLIKIGQIFVVDYTKIDGSVMRCYYRSDGYKWHNMLSTNEFIVKK